MTRPATGSRPSRRVHLMVVLVMLTWMQVTNDARAIATDIESRIGLRMEVLYGHLLGGETTLRQPSFDGAQDVAPARLHDPWLSFDKVQHFTFSALITVGGQYALVNKFSWRERPALPLSMLGSFTVGLVKELHDWQSGPRRYFSWRDMAANGAGIAVAAGFILL